MSGLVFLDTNVLVYAHDAREPSKRRAARELVARVFATDSGAISTQVIQEFCNVVRKPMRSFAAGDLAVVLDNIMLPLLKHSPTIEFYKRSIGLAESEQLNFYDALIVQAAIDLDCQTLYSEDLQDGRRYGRLTIKNPFI